jgi:hypothetical protein
MDTPLDFIVFLSSVSIWGAIWIVSIFVTGTAFIAGNIFMITKHRTLKKKAFIIAAIGFAVILFSAYMFFLFK